MFFFVDQKPWHLISPEIQGWVCGMHYGYGNIAVAWPCVHHTIVLNRTHNFLNQKPWHPSNFRNRVKTWEAQQKTLADQKEKEKAQAEFDAEQVRSRV
jgi:hypothetical protein